MTKVLPDEITLPKSATMPDIFKLEEQLAQAAGMAEHEDIFLSIDTYRDAFSYAFSPPKYAIKSVKIWTVLPVSYRRKTLRFNRPEDEAFIVSTASLKKKIEKLKGWHKSQIESKEQKEIQDREEFIEQCRADGLPMYVSDSSHFFLMGAENECETLSISVAHQFTKAQAIALNDFLNKLIQQENP